MSVDQQEPIRRQLVAGLRGEDVHMSFEEAVAGFPAWAINAHPPDVPYTPWHILEHLRITQWDILAYIRDPAHVSPDWPRGYWPHPQEEASRARFQATIDSFLDDVRAVDALVNDPATDLLAPLPHAPQHTILREVRLLANHNSYHIGEFGILRQVMGSWGRGHRR